MNYRHAYHAGNFADVLKHALFAQVIEHLKLKETPFRVIDTHAGIGSYDLQSAEASKTEEWSAGIGRLYGIELSAPLAAFFDPYLAAVRAENGPDPLTRYPGSPSIARHLLRAGDVLAVNELHPEDAEVLKREFARDRRVKVLSIDGWNALKSLLPPKERRGVVLVDPPFEEAGEFARLVDGLRAAARRFPGGTMLLWYPIKDPRPVARFHRDVASLGLPKTVAVDLMIRSPVDIDRLNGTGLVILNPPFTLAEKLEAALPHLAGLLAQGPGATARVTSLTSEQKPAPSGN